MGRTQPRYKEGPSVETVLRDNEKLKDELTRVKAERNVWAARAGADIRRGRPVNYPGDSRDHRRLVKVARALMLAAKAADPVTAVNLSDGPGRISQSDTTPDPGAATKAPRHHAARLRSQVDDAVETWETAVDHHFQPPKRTKVPKVACEKADCPSRGLRVPAWRQIKGGRTVYHERCTSCGTPYTPDDV